MKRHCRSPRINRSNPNLPCPIFLLGRTLDKTVESQRRRLLAVSIPKSLTREDVSRADEALDQLSLTFFSAPNESLANAFGAALKAVKRPPKSALISGETTGFDGGLVAAALDGQRLVVSAAEPGLVIVQQGEQLFSFPTTRPKPATNFSIPPQPSSKPGSIPATSSRYSPAAACMIVRTTTG